MSFWGKSHYDQSISVWRCETSVQLGSSKRCWGSIRAKCRTKWGQLRSCQRPVLVPWIARTKRQILNVNGDSMECQGVNQGRYWWADVRDCSKCWHWPAKVVQKAVAENTRSRTPVASGYIFLQLEDAFKFEKGQILTMGFENQEKGLDFFFCLQFFRVQSLGFSLINLAL